MKGQGKHPLEIKPSASEKRNRQSKYEIFNPIPVSIAFVAATSQGKSSQMTTVANLLQPVMERTILISHSHKFDPAWQELKDKLHEKAIKRGEHPDTHPYCFDNLTHLPAIVSEQKMRVLEAKESNAPVMPSLLLILDDLLGDMQHSKLLNSLVTRNRHICTSLLCSSQTVRGLSSEMRKKNGI